MKAISIALSALILSAAASAQELSMQKFINCESQSDPDRTNVSLWAPYIGSDPTFALVEQESGDGDDYALDLIEVTGSSNRSGQTTYRQVEGAFPTDRSILKRPSRKTREFSMKLITDTKQKTTATVQAYPGPTGVDARDEQLDCEFLAVLE